jgi:sugar phosphate isomerase/epimerase
VQAADTTRRGLGHGHLDLAAVATALASVDYGGAIVVEIMAPGPDPFQAIKNERSAEILDGDIRESLRRLRAHWPPPGPTRRAAG